MCIWVKKRTLLHLNKFSPTIRYSFVLLMVVHGENCEIQNTTWYCRLSQSHVRCLFSSLFFLLHFVLLLLRSFFFFFCFFFSFLHSFSFVHPSESLIIPSSHHPFIFHFHFARIANKRQESSKLTAHSFLLLNQSIWCVCYMYLSIDAFHFNAHFERI